MVKVFYKGKEININDLRLTWGDHFGRICSGNLMNYRNSEVNDAISEVEAGEGW